MDKVGVGSGKNCVPQCYSGWEQESVALFFPIRVGVYRNHPLPYPFCFGSKMLLIIVKVSSEMSFSSGAFRDHLRCGWAQVTSSDGTLCLLSHHTWSQWLSAPSLHSRLCEGRDDSVLRASFVPSLVLNVFCVSHEEVYSRGWFLALDPDCSWELWGMKNSSTSAEIGHGVIKGPGFRVRSPLHLVSYLL